MPHFRRLDEFLLEDNRVTPVDRPDPDEMLMTPADDVTVSTNISPVFLPPHAPKLSLMKQIWLYLRERFLSLRLVTDLNRIIEGCCTG
jgi:hypothetical protein